MLALIIFYVISVAFLLPCLVPTSVHLFPCLISVLVISCAKSLTFLFSYLVSNPTFLLPYFTFILAFLSLCPIFLALRKFKQSLLDEA